ncbi:hypothetical protein FOA52_014589 [Chlamydomonas sp. UWO 241]|nr:hypothetical protein FOA52_014589 [Chlamydomonas sp. UWO 241]
MADHAALRASIRQQLLGLGVTQEVHQALLKVQGGGAVTTEKVMLLLQESGLVAQLAGKIGPPSGVMASLANAQSSSGEVEAVRPSASKRQLLHIKVVDARAFVDYVARDAAPGEQLVLHGDLFGQRFSSRAAPACAEPQLRAEEYIELPAEGGGQPQAGGSGAGSGAGAGAGAGAAAGGGGAGALLALLPHAQPLHLAVVRTLPPPPAPPDDGGGGSMAGAAAANGGGGGGAGAAGAAPPKFGGGGDGGAAAATLAARSVAALGAAEWRTVLVRKRQVMISVQLSSGPAALAAGLPASPAGVVVLQLSLVPNSGACLDEALLHSQQRSEHARDADAMARFLGRARAWWGEFTALRPDFRTRPVKVLARCEDGAQYPACTFVAPLQLGRAVATPRQAHRFVSLLRPRELSDEDLRGGGGGGMGMAGDGGGGGGVWCLLPTVLASGSASKEEAALLLCGMLLGFGLDAWVVLGRSRNGTGHAWVLTRGPLAVPTFWEPLTGMRYGPDDAPTWPYLSVGCCFNHSVVVANCQDGDAAPGVSFLFEDPLRWRTLEVPRNDVPAPHWRPM